MNQKILIPILLFCMIALQCKKQDAQNATKYYGTVALNKNGKLFNDYLVNCRRVVSLYGSDTFFITMPRPRNNGFHYESLSFSFIIRKLEKQQITKWISSSPLRNLSAYFIRYVDDNVPAGWYELYEKDSLTNFIEITSINTHNEIKGKFNATFIYEGINRWPKFYANDPDTMRISGEFNTKILD